MVDKIRDYITTISKTHFSPSNPRIEDIKIEDIAHALSYMCRANGHFKHFYSVAQHSINCSKEAKARGYDKKIQLACLLHDASEAYISDVTSPLKSQLPKYREIEDRLQSMIYSHFNICDIDHNVVCSIDMSIFYYEFINLLDEIPEIKTQTILSLPDFEERYFTEVKNDFLNLYNKLSQPVLPNKKFIGIDISKGSWIAVIIDEHDFTIKKYTSINDIVNHHENIGSMIIDVPIGLPENIDEAVCRPDTQARNLLSGTRKSSVFSVPCRQAVWANTIEDARQLNIAILGKSIASQSFGMQKYLREVDMFLDKNSQYKNEILESHPEVLFAILNNGKSIAESKLTENGLNARIDILSKYYPKAYELKNFFSENKYPKSIQDDIVDAFSLALAGYLGKDYGYKSIPEKPKIDSKGILMQMILPDL